MRSTIVKNGTVRLAPTTNMRQQWRTSAVFSTSGPTMMPGRVAEEQHRQVEGVAELHEARRLVGAVGVDRAGEVRRVVGDDAERPALDARERGHHAARRSRGGARAPSPSSASVSMTRAHVVDAQPVLGHDRARSRRWSAHVQSATRALEVRRGTASRPRTASASSATATSTTPFGTCTDIGPTSSGRKTPRPPPSIIAGPPMPMFEFAVAITTSQQPSSAALPAKQRPELIADERHEAARAARRGGTPCSRGRRRPARRCRPAGRRRPR